MERRAGASAIASPPSRYCSEDAKSPSSEGTTASLSLNVWWSVQGFNGRIDQDVLSRDSLKKPRPLDGSRRYLRGRPSPGIASARTPLTEKCKWSDLNLCALPIAPLPANDAVGGCIVAASTGFVALSERLKGRESVSLSSRSIRSACALSRCSESQSSTTDGRRGDGQNKRYSCCIASGSIA